MPSFCTGYSSPARAKAAGPLWGSLPPWANCREENSLQGWASCWRQGPTLSPHKGTWKINTLHRNPALCKMGRDKNRWRENCGSCFIHFHEVSYGCSIFDFIDHKDTSLLRGTSGWSDYRWLDKVTAVGKWLAPIRKLTSVGGLKQD